MTSTIDTLGNKWKEEMILLFSETMHVSHNRRWHKSQKRQTLRNYMAAHCLWRMPLVSEAAVFTPFSNLVCILSLCFSRSVSWICFVFLTFLPCPPRPPLSLPTRRFADSIRGMLKLILVLMLAGASLSSTWFTLTCLSRYTHLPSTAGGSKSSVAVKVTLHTQTVQLVSSDSTQSQSESSGQVGAFAQIDLPKAGQSTLS